MVGLKLINVSQKGHFSELGRALLKLREENNQLCINICQIIQIYVMFDKSYHS